MWQFVLMIMTSELLNGAQSRFFRLWPNSAGANADYAWQFSLRVPGWRESPAAWLNSWSLGDFARAMKSICLALLSAVLFGCASAPRSIPVVPAYREVHVGMSREEVYRLVGKPHGSLAQGVRDVYTEVWVGPTDSHGDASRLSVLFWADGKAHDVKTDTVKLK